MSSELEDILAAFARLVEDHEASAEGDPEEEDSDNFRCTDCVDCVACRFCTACERCSDCTYCDACSDCADCTQSRECIACAECSQSSTSAYCEQSSYLTLCLDCDACVQCFACVGLSGAEFHILNQPYKRGAYFKKVAELRKLLDAKLTEGWTPPWVDGGPPVSAPEPEPEPKPEPLPPPPEYRVGASHPEPENTLSRDPNTEVPERASPRRVDPYTDRTSRLTGLPVAIEATGSWPPVDARTARSMDTSASEPWEELFEPDELPPPRPKESASAPSTAAKTPPAEVESPPTKPKPGRFDRLLASVSPGEPTQPKPRDPPASFLGQVPSPPAAAEPESTGSVRRAKRPRRD